MDFAKFILENNLQVAAALYVLGVFLKNSSVPDKFILLILLAFAIALVFMLNLVFTPQAIAENVMQAIFVTGMAVLINQIPKQLLKKE